jgi:hypothetical protein
VRKTKNLFSAQSQNCLPILTLKVGENPINVDERLRKLSSLEPRGGAGGRATYHIVVLYYASIPEH